MATSPLDGVRVLDLAPFGPGARATRWLADYGADVVKVEPIAARDVVSPFYAYGAGRGLRRIRLDLKVPAGRDTFLRLADSADVIVESFRPGVVGRLGIDHHTISARNPRLIYCSISGYGQASAYTSWVGHDLGYLGVGGFLANSGRDSSGLPAIPGVTLADAAGGGMQAVIAISTALYARERSGAGTFLDVSVADGVLALMSLAVDEYLATGNETGPGTSLLTGALACYGVYACRDGKDLVVAAIEPRFWRNLCRLLGLDEFADRQHDADEQPRIRAALGAVFATRSRDEWVDRLAPADTCVAPVLAIEDLVSAPVFADRNLITIAEHPEHGQFRQVGTPLAGSSLPQPPLRPTGADSDTTSLLTEAGLTEQEIDSLVQEGVAC